MHICVYMSLAVIVNAIDNCKYLSVSRLTLSKRCDRATIGSRNIFQRLRKIWVFKRKNAQFITFLPFFYHFQFFCWFLAHFLCARLSNWIISRAKKILLESLSRLLWHVGLYLPRSISDIRSDWCIRELY